MLRSRGMAQARRGRPPNPLDPGASHAARLGAEIRARRTNAGLTLEALADRVGCSPQHISEVERAKTTPAVAFVTAVDRALEADGAIERLLPPVLQEREERRQERAEARRADRDPSVPCDAATHSEVAGDDEDVEPTDRRGLLGAAGAAALGLSTAVPVAAREVDPELPAHWTRLLTLLGRHAEMFGPRGVLDIIEREVQVITAHRAAARSELRTELMRVEARWVAFAAWLCHHHGDARGRDARTDRALRLADESGDADMAAFGRGRQSKHASDARRAVEYAEAALRVRGASTQTRAWCARYAAVGHALAGATASCERRLQDAYVLLEDADSPPPPWSHGFRATSSGTRATEARCWLAMSPAKAIGFYEDALRDWPRAEVQHGGLQRARLAHACALVGELDRAKAEGAKAFVIAKQTGSASVFRELRQVTAVLRAA
jgi:transcriptional regulator with XRE-family HTH domain